MEGRVCPPRRSGGPAGADRRGPAEASRRSRRALTRRGCGGGESEAVEILGGDAGLEERGGLSFDKTALVKTLLPGEVSGAQIVQSIESREVSNDGTHETKSALLRRR